MNELQKTSAEVMKAQAEKEELSSKIQALEEQLVCAVICCCCFLFVVVAVSNTSC